MSRFWTAAAFAAGLGAASMAVADGIAAVIVPPRPPEQLSSPILPNDAIKVPSLPRTVPMTRAASVPVAEIVARQGNISNFGTPCGPSLSVTAAADAMLEIAIRAPCQPSGWVDVTHHGLSFTQKLSMTGTAAFTLPALAAKARVQVQLPDNSVLVESTEVPDVDAYARVALQWDGPDPGSLVSNAPRDLAGTMFRFGVEPRVLDVFSRRVDAVHHAGLVRLSLHADITPANCGKDRPVRVVRTVPGEPMSAYGITLQARDCEDVGRHLELKNILQDLKLGAI